MSAPNFPTSVVTAAKLRVLVNNLATALTNSIDALVDSVVLDDVTGFQASGEFTIGSEIIHYTAIVGNTATGCTRGYDGTTAVPHNAGDVINHFYIADHHNQIAAEIIAMQQYLSDKFGLDAGYTILPVGKGIIFQPSAGVYIEGYFDTDGVWQSRPVSVT